MTVQIKILSHASMLIKSSTHSIIIDPWLIGSCYWRSWWNFPEASFDESDLAKVDAVLISHLHWDHWHGPTLKKYFKEKPIVISQDPNTRSFDDLTSIKFTDIRRIKHGKSINIGNIKITYYHFGLYLTDVAMVIEVDGICILNANDCKVAGMPLNNIIKKHKPIDFAFRSHSSANPRVCYEVLDNPKYKHDDREHYFRSFKLFMDKVNPKYAIPYASNHCHLNEDVFHFNEYISDPLELREWTKAHKTSWKTQVMLPGSSWSSKKGFVLAEETPFLNKKQTLDLYRTKVKDRLDFYNQKELKVKIDERLVNRFKKFLQLAGVKKISINIRFLLTSPDAMQNQSILLSKNGDVNLNQDKSEHPSPDEALIIMPNVVFRDSVIKNMFSHAYISKRCKFIINNEEDMHKLQKFNSKIENFELIVKPLKSIYLLRVFFGYCLRWREIVVYFQAYFLLKTTKLELYEIEEVLLKK